VLLVGTKKKKKVLVIFRRAERWFYRSPEGPLVLLPYKVNRITGEALFQKKPEIKTIIVEGNFWNKNTIQYHVKFAPRELSITINNHDCKNYPIINETELHTIHHCDPYGPTFEHVNEFFTGEIHKKQLDRLSLVMDSNTGFNEWQTVSNMFHSTMPMIDKKTKRELNKIVRITKLYHPDNKKLFDASTEKTMTNHKDNPILHYLDITKLLWHGTGGTNPDVIFNVQGCFVPAYASDACLWGKGCYFASDAAYSANYAYTAPNGNKVLLLVEVVVGQVIQCLENNALFDIPVGYDSLVGYRHGAWIYVVYRDARALPVYEIEWQTFNK